LRLGTRGSALALVQAEAVAEALGGAELVVIRTSGDEGGGPQNGAGPTVSDKSRFVREIEQALIDDRVDLAVHSAKDVPGEIEEGLALVGATARADPYDAFVGPAESIGDIRPGARIGTSSLRRRAALAALRGDVEVVELRGNVDTRLRKLAEGEVDGLVLAAAGLERLGRADEISFRFTAAQMTPAPGQGIVALEAVGGDEAPAQAAGAITDHDALVELSAERAVVRMLGATCNTPIGILARLGDGTLTLHGFIGMPDGSQHWKGSIEGDPTQPVAVAEALVAQMRAAGADKLLDALR
jgi:hydroxymethylbilane synthase